MKKLNANKRIQQAKKEREQNVIDGIKRHGFFSTIWIWSRPAWNAVQRLEDAGRIRYDRRKGGYVLKTR